MSTRYSGCDIQNLQLFRLTYHSSENDAGEEITVKITVDASTSVQRYKQYALAFADLKAGRIDAILMDKLPALTMLAVAN